MAKKSENDPALNEYFEAMCFQDDEEKTWQEYTDFLVSKLESLATFFRSQSIPIDIHATGSSVEKLRIISPEDIGDIDVMVFSLAEETKIPESIMEYSIPGNPVYVRLRGKDHPILQHCLAENSNYVASVTLINFHRKVFGGSASFFNILPKVFQKIQDISSYGVACRVQSTSGPSIQYDFSQTRESLHDNVTGMKSYSNFKANDEISGLLDWMRVAFNPGKPFTEEHSATVDEASKYVEETVRRVGVDPSIQNFDNIFQELSTGPKTREFRMKMQELDTKNAEKENEEPARETRTSAKEGAGEVNDDTEKKQSPETGELKVCASPLQVELAEGFESTYDNESATRESNDDVQENLHRKEVSATTIPKETESEQHPFVAIERELQEIGATAEEAANSAVEGENIDMAKMTEEKIMNYCIENVLRVGNSSKSPEEIQKEYLEIAADETRQKGGFDIVPAFLAKGWPSTARAWISRDRLWPNQNVISDILDYGFHLVAKTPSESERPDLDFRLSFSHAEFVLSKELNDIQRQCYRCFKSYHLTIIRDRKPKIVATYYLKTILFWAVEETGMEFWNSENRGSCVMMLLGKLLKALQTRYLSHFFIPEFNLLEEVAKEFPEEMECLAEEVRKVCEDPMSYPNASPKEDQGNKPTARLKPMSDPSGEEIESCLTTATSSRPMNANLPLQEDVSTKNPLSITLGKTNDLDSKSSATAPYFLRFKDFQALYRQVYREMLELALTEEAVDARDPTTKSIVTNMRKVMEKMENDPEKEMEVVLECCLANEYSALVFHPGPTPRDRILSLLKGQCEMFAYVVRQEDLALGNEHVIVNRILDSSSDGSSDPFDLSVMYPETSSALANIFDVVAAQFQPIKKSEDIDDDIPLD